MVLGEEAKVWYESFDHDNFSISHPLNEQLKSSRLQLIDWKKNKGNETDFKTFLDVVALKVYLLFKLKFFWVLYVQH